MPTPPGETNDNEERTNAPAHRSPESALVPSALSTREAALPPTPEANAAQIALTTGLRKQAAAQQRITQGFHALSGLCAGIVLVCLALLLTGRGDAIILWLMTGKSAPLINGLGIAYAGQALGVGCNLYATAKWRSAVEAIVLKADRQAIAPLIEMFQRPSEREFAAGVLPRLLTRLTAADAPLLTRAHRAALNQFLSESAASLHWNNSPALIAPMMRAILRAYEQVGDSEAIPIVERLANGAGYARRSVATRRAAQECLPFLRERGPNETLRQNLLRASSVTQDPPEMLLRSAAFRPDQSPEELLRSAES